MLGSKITSASNQNNLILSGQLVMHGNEKLKRHSSKTLLVLISSLLLFQNSLIFKRRRVTSQRTMSTKTIQNKLPKAIQKRARAILKKARIPRVKLKRLNK